MKRQRLPRDFKMVATSSPSEDSSTSLVLINSLTITTGKISERSLSSDRSNTLSLVILQRDRFHPTTVLVMKSTPSATSTDLSPRSPRKISSRLLIMRARSLDSQLASTLAFLRTSTVASSFHSSSPMIPSLYTSLLKRTPVSWRASSSSVANIRM
jgi:hypothetical protein